MGAISRIREKLERHPELRFADYGDRIEVMPSSEEGFPVSCYEAGGEIVIGFGGWHESFSDEAEALEWFAFGLSDSCRMIVTCRGSFEYHWTVQIKDGNEWKDRNSLGLLVPVPFWRKKERKVRQNRLAWKTGKD